MGELKLKRAKSEEMLMSCAGVQTARGRVQVRWEAVVSYNPKKPGRPSHSYHTYLMAGLRLVVGAEVKAGNEHTDSHSLPGLLKILDDLPIDRKPKIVRGDDPIMGALDSRQQPYLFKLKLSKNVKRHIERLFWAAGWTDAGQGWEGKDGRLQLTGWKASRRLGVSSCCADRCRARC